MLIFIIFSIVGVVFVVIFGIPKSARIIPPTNPDDPLRLPEGKERNVLIIGNVINKLYIYQGNVGNVIIYVGWKSMLHDLDEFSTTFP